MLGQMSFTQFKERCSYGWGEVYGFVIKDQYCEVNKGMKGWTISSLFK